MAENDDNIHIKRRVDNYEKVTKQRYRSIFYPTDSANLLVSIVHYDCR